MIALLVRQRVIQSRRDSHFNARWIGSKTIIGLFKSLINLCDGILKMNGSFMLRSGYGIAFVRLAFKIRKFITNKVDFHTST
jgi:hypothetical protein